MAEKPPSTDNSTPFTKLESSEARNSATAAISSGRPIFPRGIRDSNIRFASSVRTWSCIGVAIGPGLSTFTRIFLPFSSLSHVRANERNAALLAEYTPKPGKPFTEATDPVMMIDPPSLTLRIVSCGIGVDGSEPGARGRLGGPRQCLRVDILPDVRQFAISNGNSEDPMVLKRLIRGFDSPRSEADDQNPVSLRYELGGLWVRSFHRFVSLPKYILQSRVPTVRAGQGPVLARNDPLNIFGRQRQQTLLIAAAEGRKEILHNLDILFDAHRILSFSLPSSVSGLIGRFGTILLGPNHTADDRLLLLLEQILEDELTPSAAACVHQRATLVELSQLDGCEPELFGQGRHGSGRVLVVAR